MSLIKKELTEKNGYVIEFSVSKEAYAAAEQKAYRKQVKNINVPGFRKGKAPLHIIKTMYGKDVFFEDAINECIPDAFDAAIKEAGYETVGNPKFDLVSMEGDIVLKAEGFVKPEVKIEGYKGIEIEKTVKTVTEADIDAEVDKVRDRNARFVTESDEAVKMGDTVSIDFEGFVDGVAFEGGKGNDHELTLGSGSFIPGFEEQIAGHKLGDEFDVVVTFPTEYHAADLAGKEATFKCSLKSLKQLPEADDELAKDVSEFDTLAEYREDVKARLEKKNEDEANRAVDNALADKLMELIEADIPEVMFEAETENYLRDYDTRLRQSGLDLKTYMQYTGLSLDDIRAQMRPQAEKQVKVRLALEAIARLEALDATEEEIDAEYARIAEAYSVDVNEVKSMILSEDIKADLIVGKAMQLVKDNAVITVVNA
ncbi:MAG: trigger factor [Clostridia bacterium]|nr:trigger factor [Clostridia bacterium]